ncbi:MAG: hypothetical protein AAF674_16810 [Pseudomonadota bacterium]
MTRHFDRYTGCGEAPSTPAYTRSMAATQEAAATTAPLTDGRVHYVSELSDETRALWERAEANRVAFNNEVPKARKEHLFSLVNRPTDKDLKGLSAEAAAHARFLWAVSARPKPMARRAPPGTPVAVVFVALIAFLALLVVVAVAALL